MTTDQQPGNNPATPIPATVSCDWYGMQASIDLSGLLGDLTTEDVRTLTEDGQEISSDSGLDSAVADAWVARHPVHPASAIIAFTRAHPSAYFEISLHDDRSAIREWLRQRDPGSPASTTQST